MAPADSGAPGRARTRVRRLVLHLGVLVQPYRNWELASLKTKAGKTRQKRVQGAIRPVTTGDVAGFLEARYGLIQTFYRVRGPVIGKAMEKSLGGALESLMMGHAVDPWGDATQAIQADFKNWISSRAAEQAGMSGVPTQAALRGVNHRLRHPYRQSNPRRPSFRDTGLFMASFRSWMT